MREAVSGRASSLAMLAIDDFDRMFPQILVVFNPLLGGASASPSSSGGLQWELREPAILRERP
jgi:hypothetical protein